MRMRIGIFSNISLGMTGYDCVNKLKAVVDISVVFVFIAAEDLNKRVNNETNSGLGKRFYLYL